MPTYDRAAEDLGNIVSLEHVNVQIPDQHKGTIFYVMGLGLTRDPFQQTGITNMWINAGRCQFHLPTGKAQVLRGTTGIVMPGREALLRRLGAVAKLLVDTRFAYAETNDAVEAVCPWGNRVRCHEPGGRYGRMQLGVPYVELDVPAGSAAGIARFYKEILGCRTSLQNGAGRPAAHIPVGMGQELVFRESDAAIPDYDGHHVAVYLADFSGPYARLIERGLVTRESNQHEYRFIDIVDLDSGKPLFQLEHEVRSMTHPGYARPLVNRNPAMAFAPGHEEMSWAMPGEAR